MGVADKDKTVDSIAQYMATNLFQCIRLSARITVQQCRINQNRGLYLCGSCPSPETEQQPAAQLQQRYKGDNPNTPWRGQLYARVALAQHEAQQLDQSAQPEKSDLKMEQKHQEGSMGSVRKTCIDCNRPGMAIVAKDRCGKCYYQARKKGVIQVKQKAAVPPPAAPVPDETTVDPVEPTSADFTEVPLTQASTESTESTDPVPPGPAENQVGLAFDTRLEDHTLLLSLAGAAYTNRRTLEAEILCRLADSFDKE